MTLFAIADFASELQKQGFLLASAGLGACFTVLYSISGKVSAGTYEEGKSFEVFVNILLGLISGTILGQMIPINSVGDLGTLTRPTLALIGGFSFSVVFGILDRIVETIEGLFAPSKEQQESITRRSMSTEIAAQLVEIKAHVSDPTGQN